jgi:ankyrin repeat protein
LLVYDMTTCKHQLPKALFLVIVMTFLLCCRPDNYGSGTRTRVSRETVKLAAASIQGDITEMDAAIKAGADVNGSDDIVGPPLVAAASTGNYNAVKFLLDKGANVNATDNQGMTPLMMATLSGRVDTVKYLLSNGADPNASTMIGARTAKITALSLARSKNNEMLVRLLREAGAQE